MDPVLVWSLLMAAGLAYLVFFAALRLRRARAWNMLTDSGKWEDSDQSFAEWYLFRESAGTAWYDKLGEVLTGTRILLLLPAVLAIGAMLLTWLFVIYYGAFLYLPFMGLVVFLIFNRPFDVLESFSLAGRFAGADREKFNRTDWLLLAQAYSILSKGRWFYMLVGAWLVSFVGFDYAFGAALAAWLPLHTGSWGPYLPVDDWRLIVYFLALGVASLAAVLWRGRWLGFGPAETKQYASKLLVNERFNDAYRSIFSRADDLGRPPFTGAG